VLCSPRGTERMSYTEKSRFLECDNFAPHARGASEKVFWVSLRLRQLNLQALGEDFIIGACRSESNCVTDYLQAARSVSYPIIIWEISRQIYRRSDYAAHGAHFVKTRLCVCLMASTWNEPVGPLFSLLAVECAKGTQRDCLANILDSRRMPESCSTFKAIEN